MLNDMKEEFLKFQLRKVAMNGLRGGGAGHVENCHCAGGSTFTIIVNETVNVASVMAKRCNGGDWACSKQ